MPVVMVKSKDGRQIYPLVEGKPLFIGRAKECDVHLPYLNVSRRHAVILYKNGICGVKDFNSFNGTLLNGIRITTPQALNYGDVLTISSFSIVLMAKDPSSEVAAPPSAPAANAKQLQTDSQIFANSGLLLPRAMLAEAEALNAQAGTAEAEPGSDAGDGEDTQVFLRDPPTETDMRRYVAAAPEPPAAARVPRDEAPPEVGVEAGQGESPDVSDAGGDPNQTDYFVESRERPEPEEAAPEENRQDGDPHAEEVIPLHESEARELLVLDDDEASPAAAMGGDFGGAGFEAPTEAAAGQAARRSVPPDAEADDAATDAPPLAGPSGGDGFDDPDAMDRDATDVFQKSSEGVRTVRVRPKTGRTPAGVAKLEVPPALARVIDARLVLYAQLDDLVEERKVFRSSDALPSQAAAELSRQDTELDDLPTSGEIDRQRRRLFPDDDEANPEMRSARDMAKAQWSLIRGFNREMLPPVYKEAYRLAVDEPLVRELAAAHIDHGRLVGGAVYMLALSGMARSAVSERSRISSRLRVIAGEDEETVKGGVLGRIGKFASNLANRQELKAESTRLGDLDRVNAKRSELALREMHFMEKVLVREFWKVYLQAALHFLPAHETMPVAVRAFLRHGTIGFKPWWMTDAMREFVLDDCRNNVVSVIERSASETVVLYADEYLAAVSRMECSPSLDDRLARLDKHSPEWRADRSYRRIVNARTYNELMQEMLVGLGEKGKGLDAEAAAEERLREARQRFGADGEQAVVLENELHGVTMRRENLDKNMKRIEREVVASILAAVEEAEGRFRKGELVMPDSARLIGREVEALADIAARLSGQRERFMPMVLREQASPAGDIVNDRETLRQWFQDMETRDPGVFKSTVIPAKKKHNRVELRIPPTVIVVPCYGFSCLSAMARSGMEGGHLMIPACFAREDMRGRQLSNLMADFRWDTSRNLAGLDVMQSDTLAGFFMRMRWEWRHLSKSKREKGMVHSEMSDKANWRRVYEIYLADAMNGARQLFLRNPELYAGVVGTYIELPDGVEIVESGQRDDREQDD